MLTDSERGLTVEAVASELKSLCEEQRDTLDAITKDQKEEKSELTQAHKQRRDDVSARHSEARVELESLLAVLKREAANTDSDNANK